MTLKTDCPTGNISFLTTIMGDRDILRRQIINIVKDLRCQATVCHYMYQQEHFTASDVDEVLCSSTNHEKNTCIFWKVSRRAGATDALDAFCRALELTNQLELLAKIRP